MLCSPRQRSRERSSAKGGKSHPEVRYRPSRDKTEQALPLAAESRLRLYCDALHDPLRTMRTKLSNGRPFFLSGASTQIRITKYLIGNPESRLYSLGPYYASFSMANRQISLTWRKISRGFEGHVSWIRAGVPGKRAIGPVRRRSQEPSASPVRSRPDRAWRGRRASARRRQTSLVQS